MHAYQHAPITFGNPHATSGRLLFRIEDTLTKNRNSFKRRIASLVAILLRETFERLRAQKLGRPPSPIMGRSPGNKERSYAGHLQEKAGRFMTNADDSMQKNLPLPPYDPDPSGMMIVVTAFLYMYHYSGNM